jgi:hypothetical protein
MAPTDGDGIFRLNVGGAATYTVQVVTPGGETVSPATLSATVSSSNTRIFVGTFTVTSSLGALAGSVSYQSKRITTGVYIIASTTTVPADPPVLNQSFRTVGSGLQLRTVQHGRKLFHVPSAGNIQRSGVVYCFQWRRPFG